MAINWEEFDKDVDIENLEKDVEKASTSEHGDFAEVPYGKYEVKITKLELTQSKKGASGTALMLADSVNEVFDGKKRYVEGRSGIVGPREKSEIGIHAVRGGTIVGEHEVMFAGEDEILTVSHSARSKRVFAAGAVKAAKFLKGKAPGRYDMNDLLAENAE